ncbi:MAG: AAA family ATPase [Betaproteobacteria bacterium]|nr:AAA family ATPase [Betaproteobacteria bacterium]
MPESLRTLVQALLRPECYDHDVERIALIETHISYVLLTGPYAYKIKKPLDLGFLDFRTLALRRFYCIQEWRLNRRFAPDLYLSVVALTGSRDRPKINEAGPVLEYALKMRQFPQNALLSTRIERGMLTVQDIDACANRIATFHQAAPTTGDAFDFGTAASVYAPVAENFRQIVPLLADRLDAERVAALEAWTRTAYAGSRPILNARRRGGWIREGHGDLHAGNIALLNQGVVPFDCIEFNESLRWIDVMNDLAFLVMDLIRLGQRAHATRLRNRYLMLTGDYEGLRVWRFYLVYRALVRAKIAFIRAGQAATLPHRRSDEALGRDYLRLAEQFIASMAPALIVTHGLSGAGKTFVAEQLCALLDAVQIRSDVERKRLFGLSPEVRTLSGLEAGLYGRPATEKTYARLRALAHMMLSEGFSVMVDAAFLKRSQREVFRQLARDLTVPFVILQVHAPAPRLHARIAQRLAGARDASEADRKVLEHQMQTREPLTPDEASDVIDVDNEGEPDWERVGKAIMRRISTPPGH